MDLSPETIVDGHISLSMDGIPRPGDPEYGDWAELARDVSDVMEVRNLPRVEEFLFSTRMAVATDLWRRGYRRPA